MKNLVTILIFSLVLLCLCVGCGRKGTLQGTPAKRKEKIVWKDPESVMKGFFRAKKTGDWKTAYKCSDFKETLSRKEARAVKKEWKKDSVNWVENYANHYWLVLDSTIKGKDAVVTVILTMSTYDDEAHTVTKTYDEILKRYGRKWKITQFPFESSEE